MGTHLSRSVCNTLLLGFNAWGYSKMKLYRVYVLFFVILAAYAQSDAPAKNPYTCSPTSPCKIGCCGKNNVCGLGPDYCSTANCTSTCDQKSECDPGWGATWSTREKCPLNVCCSKFGFCGTTAEFCGDKKVKQPSCKGGKSASQKIIGYYAGWSTTRACGGLFPESLMYNAYTHLNFAFAFIDPKSFQVAPMSEADTEMYPRFTGLKEANPGLKTWISIGGWSMNDPEQPTARTFSELAASKDAQSKFFSSLLNFMSTYGFDGVDIDWEYPVAPERSGKPEDYANYVSFLKNLKNALGSDGHTYGLTLTLPSSYWYLQHFDIKSMAQYLDWFNIMSYDLHGTWDSSSPWLGPYVNAHTNLTEIDLALDLLWRNEIDPKKVVLGIGFYGRSFTLSDPSCKSAGCPFSSGGTPGKCTASAGTLSYAEIQEIVQAGAKVTTDDKAGVEIVTWDNNQWVSYDSPKTLKKKMDYANEKCLNGIMMWAASTDDANGTAIRSLTDAAGRKELSLAQRMNTKSSGGQCVWSGCGESCPPELTPAASGNGKSGGYAGLETNCKDGKQKRFCCPKASVPTCTWRGSGPFCIKSGCNKGEVEVATNADGCITNAKNLCCTSNTDTSAYNDCKWEGSAPFCTGLGFLGTITNAPWFYGTSADCPKEHPKKIATGKYGDGGEQPCTLEGGFKSWCCKDPPPWTGCEWHGARGTWKEWANAFLPLLGHGPFLTDCSATCPSGKIVTATDATACRSGTYSLLCCDDPNVQDIPVPSKVDICCTPYGGNQASTPDGEGPGTFCESNYFDLHCNTCDAGLLKERTLDGILTTDVTISNTTFLGLEQRSVLDKRAKPVPASEWLRANLNGLRTTFTRYNYPTVRSLNSNGGAGRQFVYLERQCACGRSNLITTPTRGLTLNFDAEHVFPPSTLRNAIEAMARGRGASGTELAARAVPSAHLGIFTADGPFQQPWPSGFRPAFGATPQDTMFGMLGRSNPDGDTTNLYILERNMNAHGIATPNLRGWVDCGMPLECSIITDTLKFDNRMLLRLWDCAILGMTSAEWFRID
ncbi:glycoside hydrolase family 18 protein [Dothidotthia symphoricarpi CBS 119687]|uniref:chitinase n=1 Tax=Dothidotthia symphoricarpi CBS 119687 TaxID=1392245 RepID=A0A6A6AS61_9PLEO|nr:glycoside hydrolase family 18 protein [Dothidotthia symphoricarpi CBS 119687]KAF2134779.1 glycoside hydrolase family 18 protein [Dothidotthia symphoricarpi CBS 119687]